MQNEIHQIKSSLSGKSLPIQNANLYNGLSIVPPQEVNLVGHMFGTGKTLPSNPFFPKSFGGGGKKKKKKRKWWYHLLKYDIIKEGRITKFEYILVHT